MLGNGKGPSFTDRAAVAFKSPHHQASYKRQTDTSSWFGTKRRQVHMSHHPYNERLESELERELGNFLESRRSAKQTCRFLMQFNSTAVSHFTV